MEKAKKVSVKKAWEYNLRGIRAYWKISPMLICAIIIEGMFSAAAPYAGIWLSARFIDELTGERRPGRLWELAAAVLLAELVLNICCQMLLQRSALQDRRPDLYGKISGYGLSCYG